MAKYEINRKYNPANHKQTVEAGDYRQEGEYFVFYERGTDHKVLTIAARLVHSIDEVVETKA